jgi:hypothetical protein
MTGFVRLRTPAPLCFRICVAKIGIDIAVVNMPETSPQQSGPARVSKNVFRLMMAIVIALALVAIYANVQRWRRARIETVTFTAVPTPSPTPVNR